VFLQPQVSTQKLDAVHLACVRHRGPYSEIGPKMTRISDLYPGATAAGVYLDDPTTVPAEQLRSYLCVLQEKGAKPAAADVEMVTLPATTYVASTFPYMSIFSYMLGPKKVYPLLAVTGGCLGFEVYQRHNHSTIEYYMPQVEKTACPTSYDFLYSTWQ
jgi:hypothetical protein